MDGWSLFRRTFFVGRPTSVLLRRRGAGCTPSRVLFGRFISCVMALVLGIASTKGGSGKTTLAINLARAIQLEGNEVLLIDTDPQRTVTKWKERQPESYDLPVRHVEDAPTAVSLQKRIALLQEEADAAVVDGSPKRDGTTRALVRAAHAVLIPVQPTPADLWATRSVVDMADRTDTPAAFVISRQIVGTNLAAELTGILEEHDLPVFESRISQRVAYAEAMNEGRTVLDISGTSKAREEVRGVATELAGLLKKRLAAELETS